MKTTMKLMLMLLVTAGMVTFSSCRKVFHILPETITVSGHVTDDAGQPIEDVAVGVTKSSLMSLIIPVTGTTTDEDGFYQVEFTPEEDQTYIIHYEFQKDDCFYKESYHADKWKPVQKHDVVLTKE